MEKLKQRPSRFIRNLKIVSTVIVGIVALEEAVTKLVIGTPSLWIAIHNAFAIQSPVSDSAQYDRLDQITSGHPTSPCAPDGRRPSQVELFDNGWLVTRFSYQIFYAIEKIGQRMTVAWTSHLDDSAGRTAACPGVPNQQQLKYGFRYWYCDSAAIALRKQLGNPISPEFSVWTEFQQYQNGLLISGLPTNVAVKNGAIAGVQFTDGFYELAAVFLDNADRKDADGFFGGRMVLFSPHNSAQNVYCTALWHPAHDSYWRPPDVDENKCQRSVPASTYLDGHERCVLFGFE